MIQFEDKLRESAQRLATRDNQRLHVPNSPLAQKRSYWGWVATPAAAVAGIVLGMSMNLFLAGEPEVRIVENTDTVCIERPHHLCYASRGESEGGRSISADNRGKQASLGRGRHSRLYIRPMRRHQLRCAGAKLINRSTA